VRCHRDGATIETDGARLRLSIIRRTDAARFTRLEGCARLRVIGCALPVEIEAEGRRTGRATDGTGAHGEDGATDGQADGTGAPQAAHGGETAKRRKTQAAHGCAVACWLRLS